MSEVSERHRGVLADLLPSQAWTARPDGTLDYVNQRVLDYFARSLPRMLGEGWQHVVHPDDLPGCVEQWIRSLTTGEPYDVEFRLQRGADDVYRWHKGMARAVRDASGAIVQWLGTNTDIDDERQTQRNLAASADALRHSERQLRLALEAGKFGTWEWDLVAGVVRWSPEIEAMHGLPPGGFDGTFDAYKRDIHPADLDRVLATVQVNIEKGADHALLYRIVRPDGEVRWLEAHGRFDVDGHGKARRLVGVCSDVTDRVQTDAARLALVAAEAARNVAEQAALRTQQILAAIADVFVVCRADWTVDFVNEEGARLFGVAPEQVRGLSLWARSGRIGGPAMEEGLRQAMRNRAVATLETRIESRDEWLEVTAYPLPDGGLAIYARDITDRKLQELVTSRLAASAALRAEVAAAMAHGSDLPAMLQRCCDAVVTHLPMAFARIWVLDGTGQWLELCGSAGKYTHLDGAHARVRVGQLKIGLIAAERLPHLTNAVFDDERVADKEWARREGMVAFAGFPLLAGESLVGVLAGFASVPLPDDTLNALAGASDAIAHGIERRRSELALDARARELARSNAELEQFAYVASHDLQEPLRIIASYNQLLERRYKDKLDQDANEFIAFTVDGVTRMQRLINDLLAFSRVGTRKPAFQAVSLERVLGTALRNLRQTVDDQHAVVTHDALPEVTGDEGQLTQLLQNLVANAIKFHGAAPPAVHVSARFHDGQWIFEVRDNGVGIEPQYFERIFVIFQRLHSTERYAGTGIGLAVCKKVVERHGGRIWVASEPGKGSTFAFTLSAREAGAR